MSTEWVYTYIYIHMAISVLILQMRGLRDRVPTIIQLASDR